MKTVQDDAISPIIPLDASAIENVPWAIAAVFVVDDQGLNGGWPGQSVSVARRVQAEFRARLTL